MSWLGDYRLTEEMTIKRLNMIGEQRCDLDQPLTLGPGAYTVYIDLPSLKLEFYDNATGKLVATRKAVNIQESPHLPSLLAHGFGYAIEGTSKVP